MAKGNLVEIMKAQNLLPNDWNGTILDVPYQRGVKLLVNKAKNALKSHFYSEIIGDGVIIVHPPIDTKTISFEQHNWSKVATNENNINKVFDFLVPVITYVSNGEQGGFDLAPNPVKFKNFEINCYGIGKMEGHWKGGRIKLVQFDLF